MGEVRVYGGSDNFTANLPEFISSVTKCDDLGWAHECEVQRVEEEDDILSCTKGKYKIFISIGNSN